MKVFFDEHTGLNYYKHIGKTDIVYVLIHGIFSNHEYCFKKQIEILESRGHSVIAPDLPGHGGSIENEPITLNSVVKKIHFIIKNENKLIKDKKMIIVGHSLGSFVTQRLAFVLQDQYRIPYIILVCGYFHNLDFLSKSLFQFSLKLSSNVPEDLFQKFKTSNTYKVLLKLNDYYARVGEYDEKFAQKATDLITPDRLERIQTFFSDSNVPEILPSNINYNVINIRGESDIVSIYRNYATISKMYAHKCFSSIIPDSDHGVLVQKSFEIDYIFKYFENNL